MTKRGCEEVEEPFGCRRIAMTVVVLAVATIRLAKEGRLVRGQRHPLLPRACQSSQERPCRVRSGGVIGGKNHGVGELEACGLGGVG